MGIGWEVQVGISLNWGCMSVPFESVGTEVAL